MSPTLLFLSGDLAVPVDQRRRKARSRTDDDEVQSERHSQRFDDFAASVTDGSRRPVDKEGHIASKVRCQPLKLAGAEPQLPKSIQGHQRRGCIARPSGQARSGGDSLHQSDADSRLDACVLAKQMSGFDDEIIGARGDFRSPRPNRW